MRTTKMAFMDHVVKPPREVRRQQARFGTSNVTSKADGKKKHFPAFDMISVERAKQKMAERGLFPFSMYMYDPEKFFIYDSVIFGD